MQERKLRLQRNILLGGLVLMITSNVFLSVKVNSQTYRTILVPTLTTELAVGTDHVSKEYLRLRAGEVVALLFSLTKENNVRIQELLLKQVAKGAQPEFAKQIDILASDIQKRDYYYRFAEIQGYVINSEQLKVKIKGYLETYFADKKIGRNYREYELTFENNGGVVLLNSFKEISNEK